MKKLLTGLCLALLLLLCACGTSKEAKAVIDNINSIEELDVNDIDLIKETSQMYNALSDEDKEKVTNYSILQDAENRLPELEKQLAIQNDKTPPIFSGLEQNEIIKVKCGTDFNLNDYLAKKLKVTDDVTEGDLEYQTTLDEKVYDGITGKVDTREYGEYPITLSAKDEAGNEGVFSLNLKLTPIHVTKKHPHPTIYDGEYGIIKLKKFDHINDYDGGKYIVVLDVKNNTDKTMIPVLSGATSINDYQLGSYHEEKSILPGKRSAMESYIYDSDIPDDIGKYSTIESSIMLLETEEDEQSYFRIPIIFDVNVSK